MVSLIPQDDIDRLNIDTVERAITFGALALQTAISLAPDNEALKQKVKLKVVSSGRQDVGLQIDVNLPFESYYFAKYGGEFIRGVASFDLSGVNLFVNDFDFGAITPTPNAPRLPKQRGLGHFEKYFYYYCEVLFLSLQQDRNNFISITQVEGLNGSELKIRVNLPYKTANNNSFNVINSLDTIVTNLITSNTTAAITVSGNLPQSQTLTNSVLLLP